MNYRELPKRVFVADDLDFSQESLEADEYLMDLCKEEAEEKGEKRGIKLGKKRGVRIGKQEEKRDIARNMLKKNMDISLISELTDLSEEQITSIKF